MEKDLWFKRTEFDGRLSQVQRELGDRGLGGALVFQPETITWLTGFFTAGHGYFELAIVPPAGPPVHKAVSSRSRRSTTATSRCRPATRSRTSWASPEGVCFNWRLASSPRMLLTPIKSKRSASSAPMRFCITSMARRARASALGPA